MPCYYNFEVDSKTGMITFSGLSTPQAVTVKTEPSRAADVRAFCT